MYAPFLGKREIGDKTGNEWGNEAGGKPPAPPVQPAGGSEVGGSRTPPLKKTELVIKLHIKRGASPPHPLTLVNHRRGFGGRRPLNCHLPVTPLAYLLVPIVVYGIVRR